MLQFIIAIQSNEAINQIKHKIETAPNKWYEIGVAIGSFIPFIVFALIVFLVFKSVKNRNDLQE